MASRIRLTDTFMSAAVKLAEGNPGAITGIMEMAKASPSIDPQSAFGAFAPLLSLDTHKIYGSRIWLLYSDLCGKDVVRALGLLRAVQLGFLPESTLSRSIDQRGVMSLDEVDAYVDQVKVRLPAFAAVQASEA